MKCPIDQTEMEKGFACQDGEIWKEGTPKGIGLAERLSLGGKFIYVYRCSKCGKIELTTEVK